MNSCLAVVIITMQIFLGDGQEHTITVTGCVDWDTAAHTAPQQQPSGAQTIRRDYESMADLGLSDDGDLLFRPDPDVGRGEMGVIYE